MSTFLELCQQVRQEVGVSGTGPVSTQAQVGTLKKICDCVKEADHAICVLWSDWDFLWKRWNTPVLVLNLCDPPTDIGCYDKESFLFDNEPLSFIPWKKFRGIYESTNNVPPNVFTIRPDNKIQIDTAPTTGALTANYFITPVKLDQNTDVPKIPERFDRVTLEFAKYLFAVQFKDQELEKASLDHYKALLPKLEAACLPDREDGYQQAVPMVIESV